MSKYGKNHYKRKKKKENPIRYKAIGHLVNKLKKKKKYIYIYIYNQVSLLFAKKNKKQLDIFIL